MRLFRLLQIRSQMLLRRSRQAARLDDELSFHLEQQIREHIVGGMSEEQARKTALRSFGNRGLVREQARATWSWSRLNLLVHDVRLSVRTLARSPGFASIAILVMALGIGANVAMFTVVRSVLLKPLPFAEQDRLMAVYEKYVGDSSEDNVVSSAMYEEWHRQNQSFTELAISGGEDFNLAGAAGSLPEKLHGVNVSQNLLPALGVQPLLGRNFTADEDQPSSNGTVLLSWALMATGDLVATPQF